MSNNAKDNKSAADVPATDVSATDECALFESLIDLEPHHREERIQEIATASPDGAARITKLLKIHFAAETKTAVSPQRNSKSTAEHASAGFLRASGKRLEPGTEVDCYTIEQWLGSGGEANVYRAQQKEPVQRVVALKIQRGRSADSSASLARFHMEKQTLARLSHDGIAKLFDAGVTPDGQQYFAVEFVDGQPITQYCEANQLSVGERLRLFLEVCRAIHYANGAGVLHRDIKPSNIMVSDSSGRARVVVIDFGIAKNTDVPTGHTLTRSGDLLGTIGYMPPERIADARISNVRCEVYSLGAVLYELLSSAPLWNIDAGKGIYHAVTATTEHDFVKPSLRVLAEVPKNASADFQVENAARSKRLSGELDWVCMKALAKSPDDRYDSAAAFQQDVQRFIDGQPVAAAPPHVWYQVRKLYHRHRLAVVSALIAVGATLLMGMVSLFWALKLDVANRSLENANSRLETTIRELEIANGETKLLAQERHNETIGLQTAVDYLTDAMQDPSRSYAAMAVFAEESFHTDVRDDLVEFSGDEKTEIVDLNSIQFDGGGDELPKIPIQQLNTERLRFTQLLVSKQSEAFGQRSPLVAETLLRQGQILFELKDPSSAAVIENALEILKSESLE